MAISQYITHDWTFTLTAGTAFSGACCWHIAVAVGPESSEWTSAHVEHHISRLQVGLLVSSPIFAEASKHHNAFRLIAVGLGIWTLATAGCGLAWGFWSLIACRMLVGVGEASFVALASPFIGPSRSCGPTPAAQLTSPSSAQSGHIVLPCWILAADLCFLHLYITNIL